MDGTANQRSFSECEDQVLVCSCRRDFLRLGGLTGAAASFAGTTAATPAAAAVDQAAAIPSAPNQFNEFTILRLQAAMQAGHLTSLELVNYYLARINLLDQNG